MFSKLPTWWVKSEKMSFFSANDLGVNIASLKCYLALALKMNFYTHKYKVSKYDLESMTSLSRPMVTKGLLNLENLELIEIDRSEHTHTYCLLPGKDDLGWAKIPTRALSKALKEMTNNRMRTTLLALKVYIYLLSIRPNDKNFVCVQHDKIRCNTYIQPNQVRPAIDVLINFGLIAVYKQPNNEGTKIILNEGINHYCFLGLKIK